METKSRGKGLEPENTWGYVGAVNVTEMLSVVLGFWIPALTADFFDAGYFRMRNNWNICITKSNSLQPF